MISNVFCKNSTKAINSAIRRKICARLFSDSSSDGGSVTYSGGQANFGQGGFYGSGGSRVSTAPPKHNPEVLASQKDIIELARIYSDVEGLETELRSCGAEVNSRTIELKSKIQKMINNPRVQSILSRLEVKGEPAWGLSSKERDLVRAIRRRYNGKI